MGDGDTGAGTVVMPSGTATFLLEAEGRAPTASEAAALARRCLLDVMAAADR